MPSQPPSGESEAKAEDEEAPADSQERFETLARGLLQAPRGPVLEAERKFKERQKGRPS
jgi:hypothetical protein